MQLQRGLQIEPFLEFTMMTLPDPSSPMHSVVNRLFQMTVSEKIIDIFQHVLCKLTIMELYREYRRCISFNDKHSNGTRVLRVIRNNS